MSSSQSSVSDVGLVQDLLREQTEEIQRLNSALDGKEQLVQAITARLEETVEQLDRMQRQGNSRNTGGGASAGGIKEILDSQQAVAQRVDESLQYWEGTAGYFEQILERLNEIARSSTGPGPGLGSSTGSGHGSAPASGGSTYEKMKASLLAQSPSGPAPSTASAHPSTPAPTVPASAAPALPPLLMAAAASIESNCPPPVPVDTDLASREELVEAIRARDAYITSLVQEGRRRDDAIFHNIEWSKLVSAPEDLRPQLVELSKRLREAVQREEHSQSMERARLAREQARIDVVKQQLEAQIRRLANPPGAAGTTPAAPSESAPAKPAKDSWLSRLKR